MDKVFFCIAHLIHYDKYEGDDRKALDHSFEPHLVVSPSQEEAMEYIKTLYTYNKQYFEYHKAVIAELDAKAVAMVVGTMVKKYSDIGNGQQYRLISDDVFVKGKESWSGNPDWLVLVKGDA